MSLPKKSGGNVNSITSLASDFERIGGKSKRIANHY